MRRNLCFALTLLFLISAITFSHAQIITTYAGTGTGGYSGDNGAATLANLHGPASVVVDTNDNVYVADEGNDRIRKITPAGIITTYAQVPYPVAMAFDHAGNLYITSITSRIYKVTPSGATSIFAGTGSAGYDYNTMATASKINDPQGIAVDDAGNVLFSDTFNGIIREVATNDTIYTLYGNPYAGGYTGDGGPAANATFDGPTGLAFDAAGNLYIADETDDVIRVINRSSGIINTLVNTNFDLNSPQALTFDAGGSLYIVDRYNDIIRKVAGGYISTVAGLAGDPGYSGDGGSPLTAEINIPLGVAVDKHGNMYIGDAGNNVVRKVCAQCSGQAVNTVINDPNIKLYPNPTFGSATLVLPQTITEATITVTDIYGRVVMVRNSSGNKNELDFEDMPHGTYIVKVNSAGKDYIQKLSVW